MLQEALNLRPSLYADELVWMIWDLFGVWVSKDTVLRWLRKSDWRKKRIRFIATERDQELRNDWIRRLCQWKHYHLVFVDESAANERTKDRKHGWAPIGVRPTEKRTQKRSERWSVLPAYTSSGYITHEIYQGSYNTERFNQFIAERVLPLCNPFPAPHSVIVLDNASIHRSPELRAMCEVKGVRLEFLPPYSPDYNPIEESFAELKAWMRKYRDLADSFDGNFAGFIELAVQSLTNKAGRHFITSCISLND